MEKAIKAGEHVVCYSCTTVLYAGTFHASVFRILETN